MNIKICLLILLLMRSDDWSSVNCYKIFQTDVVFNYDIEAKIELIPDVQDENQDETTWSFNGLLAVQRIDDLTIAMKLDIDKNQEELKPLSVPFKLKTLNESSILLMQHPQKAIEFQENEPIWSANIKRAIASLFQVEGSSEDGAFVSNEFGLFGLCPTEYYVVNSTDELLISKIYDMDNCHIKGGIKVPGGIFEIRSNIPINICEIGKAAHAVTSRLGEYKMMKLKNSQYLLKSIYAESKSNVQASESYYPQFIFTKIHIDLNAQNKITTENQINFDKNGKTILSDFTYVMPITQIDATGGRAPKSSDQIIKTVLKMLKSLAEHLEHKELNFDEPYMEIISEIVRLIETMNYEALKKLYDQIDIGTSYIQETSRNIFLEILPRVGTASSVLLTKYLIETKSVRSTTAVQLLTALPFFISELSYDLIKECEVFLHVGLDRPDVKHSAVLSYSTIIYKAYVAGAITSDQFEKYVKTIFDLFLNSFEYEQQMLYLEAMGNLQLGNVPNYLQPIIQADYSQTTDIRFLAIFATMPTAYTRSEKVYETYWPIFYSKTTPLQLRIAAFTMLLVSAPTPGRLLGLFNVIKNENCPHMINFYRTTILGISESTYSCLSHLKRLTLYMRRHLPKEPPKKFWITGNYIFDYKDRKFHIGSMLQILLIGDRKKDLPMIAFLKFDTEAMGRFTGQLALYIKARGLSDAILDRLSNFNAESLNVEELSKILKLMKVQPIQSTPLHLEFIVQYEGKTILSYYLNQTTFYDLTDGDIINRISTILRADSHINMQIVRRPFLIKHGFSTLIGTPANILIENTMIASIRGSTTQNLATDKITRKNHIDLRYSSYAVAKILSYNPIDDIEYSTIREQGFLAYLPLNNEIIINLAEKFVTLSFYRKETITSGMTLKSRKRSFTGSKDISRNKNTAPAHQFNLDDIGINILIGHNVESSKENLIFLFESDVHTSAKVFTQAPYSIVQNILTLISMIQLTSIHISRDKHLTVLLTNEPNSKVELTFKYESEDFLHDTLTTKANVIKFDCNLLHILDYSDTNPKQLHKWEFSTKFTTFKSKEANTVTMSFDRQTKNGDKWKLCTKNSYDGLVHFRKPFIFTSEILFGDYNNLSTNCSNDESKINISLSIGSPNTATEKYEMINVKNVDECTKEILKFSPIPDLHECKFDKVLSINDIHLKMDFEKMPHIFYKVANKIDHFLSALLPNSIDKLNISDYINLQIKLPNDAEEETEILINQNSAQIPIGSHLKHGSLDQSLVDYSFTSVCTLYKNNLNSLSENHYKINDSYRMSHSNENEMLFVAECSETPQTAIFVEYKNNSNEFLQIKIYAGGSFITIRSEQEPIIYYENKQHNLKESAFEYPSFERYLRASLSDESIIQIENDIIKAKIQYNMKSLISISLPTILKSRLCGLCSMSKNKNC